MTNEVIASGDANTYHRIESVRAVNIQVEHESQMEEDRPADYVACIHIFGRPAHVGFKAKSALICFYPDGDSNISKPSYDETRRQIRICYPMSLFEAQVEILTRHYEVECTYQESATMSDRNAYLHGNGIMPEQMH